MSTQHAAMYEGGCFCGAIRYRAIGEPIDTGYCHCSICRRTTAAPVAAWAVFALEAFAYLRGAPVIFRSSAWGQRQLCGQCGTQIAYQENSGAVTISVNVCSLDAPETCAPRCHIFTADRLRWFDTADRLPRFSGPGPETGG